MRGITLTIAALAAVAIAPAARADSGWDAYVGAFRSPGTEMRPKISMGMPGVPEPADIKKQYEEYKAAGFRGLVLGFGGATSLVDGAFPATQTEGLAAAQAESKRLGMTVDMPLGAGWPLRTPRTTDRTSPEHQQELVYGTLDVAGPAPYAGPVPPAKDMGVPLLTGTARAKDHQAGKLVAVVAGKVAEEGTPVVYPAPGVAYTPSAAGVTFPLTHPAKSTVLDPASLIDLTNKVDASGLVQFTPPSAGHWVLFAFYQRPTSQDTVDHLRANAARTALEDIEQQQITPKYLGGFPAGSTTFQDSLELFFAGVPWTEGFLAKFKAARGYDLTRFLPGLFIQGAYQTPGFDPAKPLPNADYELTGDTGRRVRRDFEQTLNDLYANDHLKVFQKWAQSHGVRQRAQVAYGTRFDQVRAARELSTAGGVVDVEQLNAGDPVGRTSSNWWFALDLYRAAVSGVHQGGGTELSSEDGSTFGRGGYITSLSEAKAVADKQMAAGITTPILTGTWTTPENTWPSSNVLFADWKYKFRPEFRMMRRLTDYWARGAQVLRTGRPQTDVAIYRDNPTSYAATVFHIPMGVVDHNVDPQLPAPVFHDAYGGYTTDAAKVRNPAPYFDTRPLEERGYSLNYLDPEGLSDRRAAGKGVLFPNGPAYRALVIDQRAMPAEAAERLAKASVNGLSIVVVGSAPTAGAGNAAAAKEDARVRSAFRAILASRRTRVAKTQADVAGALAKLGVRPRLAFSERAPIYTQMRRAGNTDVWLLWNAHHKAVSFTGSFATNGVPSSLDLWTGEATRLGRYGVSRSRVDLPLTLRAGETKVIAFTGDGAARAPHVMRTSARDVRVVGGRLVARDQRDMPAPRVPESWHLHVDASNPEESKHDVDLTALADWRDIPELEHISGVGTYTTALDVPRDWLANVRGAQLDLGAFCGAIEIYVNDRRVPAAATPDTAYTIALPAIPRITGPVDVTRYLRAGRNELRIVLATSLANAVKHEAMKGSTAAPDGTVVPTQPYGLLGPVKLQPFATVRVR